MDATTGNPRNIALEAASATTGDYIERATSVPIDIGSYGLPLPTTGQTNWHWCHKCQGRYFAGHATQGKCPAGGAHDQTGSGDYRLMKQTPLAPGQPAAGKKSISLAIGSDNGAVSANRAKVGCPLYPGTQPGIDR